MSSDILSLYIILCIEFKIKRERERLIVSSFFSRKLNSSHRKFDKSFSSLKFSSLCSSRSHYLPVVTFKLFFSFNCLILPFSISWKIYSDPPGQSMQFCIKERNERERERRCSSQSQTWRNSSIKSESSSWKSTDWNKKLVAFTSEF